MFILTCEYDMLQREGQTFAERLKKGGGNVRHFLVKGVKHAWDKHPRIVLGGEQARLYERRTEEAYGDACAFLESVLTTQQS